MKRRTLAGIALSTAVTLGITAPMLATPAHAATSMFNVTFEDGTLGGFNTTATSPDAIAIAADPDGSGKALRFTSATTATESFQRYGSWTGTLTLTARVYFDDTTHDRSVFLVSGQGTYGTLYQNLLTFTRSGTLTVGGVPGSTTYTSGRWYPVKAVVNNTTGTFDAWLDGKQVAAQQPIAPTGSGWTQTTSVRVTQTGVPGTTGTMYLDDLAGVQDATRDLGQSIDGWQERAYTAQAPDFTQDTTVTQDGRPTLRIQAASGSQGSLWKDFPARPGADYAVRTTVKIVGGGTGTSATIKVTPLHAGTPLQSNGADLTTSGSGRSSATTFTGDAAFLRTPAGTDALRVELYFSGPGTAWFTPGTVETGLTTAGLGRYSSADVQHPVKNPRNMFGGGQWTSIADQSDADKQQAVAPLLAMSDSDLTAAARTAAASRKGLTDHPAIEQDARRLADLYKENGDEHYARAAILILRQFTESYPSVPYFANPGTAGFGPQKTVPIDAVYAYDLLYHSGQWAALAADTGVDVRSEVEDWFRQAVINQYNLYHSDSDNIDPYGIAQVMGTACVLNDPDMIRLFVPAMDHVYTGESFYATGLWKEATISYQDQVTGLAKQAFQMLKDNFTDPAGYTDSTYGLKLDHSDLGSLRYPLIAQADKVDAAMHLPNGQLVPLNDTWVGPDNLSTFTADSPIQAADLHNIELYDYGHYALTQGDTTDATQIHLNAPQIEQGPPYASGHQHAGDLDMMLWGAGVEAVPDVGYAHNPSGYRYFQMDAVGHNVPFVWSKDNTDYAQQGGLPTRAAVLGYDPGTASGGKVQFVEASDPGPAGNGTTTKRRLVMLVQLAGNRSYAVDLSTLKGGQAHRDFLRASEQESDTLTASTDLTPHTGTVQDYLTATGRNVGLPDYRTLMRDPQTADGERDMNFTWTGKDTGSSVRAYINGQSGDQLIFSKIPTNRRTLQDAARKDDFPNWHFQRLRQVDPDQTTLYGAVYETWRKNQQPLVNGVQWLPAPDGDPQTTTAVVDGGSFTDLVYLSNDDKPRTVQGVTFSGHVAVARIDKATGAVQWGYAYGNGSVRTRGYILDAPADLTVHAVATTSAGTGAPGPVTDQPDTITVDGDLPQDGSLDGTWLRITLGDGRGWAMRVDHIQGRTIHVHDWVPFTVSAEGARYSFAGGGNGGQLTMHGDTVPGPVTITLSRSTHAPTDAAMLHKALVAAAKDGTITDGAAQALPQSSQVVVDRVQHGDYAGATALLESMRDQVSGLSGKQVDPALATALTDRVLPYLIRLYQKTA
ncbi:alginate lyase family protein [Streptomyces sp. NPDC052107]|uniref:alginate lyase family protein n=1 Tax=Streptomyces sp. NPDC052107 TaxID=3155632 RepID=UPI00344AF425